MLKVSVAEKRSLCEATKGGRKHLLTVLRCVGFLPALALFSIKAGFNNSGSQGPEGILALEARQHC